ncbi:hypothetical protein AB0D86_44635 [Streptomyces sp. NPDC048324]
MSMPIEAVARQRISPALGSVRRPDPARGGVLSLLVNIEHDVA